MRTTVIAIVASGMLAPSAFAGLFSVAPQWDADPWSPYNSSGLPLYDNSVQTGFRYNPGSSPIGPLNPITYDDVPIPVGLLGGFGSIDVTRVTVGIRQV